MTENPYKPPNSIPDSNNEIKKNKLSLYIAYTTIFSSLISIPLGEYYLYYNENINPDIERAVHMTSYCYAFVMIILGVYLLIRTKRRANM